ncbi:MAG: glycosyltransferase [Lachnospiraceae bacterium]
MSWNLDNTAALELNRMFFEEAVRKNHFISDTKKENLLFANLDMTNQGEIFDVLSEYDFLSEYDMVVFGDNVPQGEASVCDVIDSFTMEIFGFCVKRSVLNSTGCFNERLSDGGNLEFICRVAEKFRVFFVECADETCSSNEGTSDKMVVTLSYILKKYMLRLKNEGRLDCIFNVMTDYMEKKGFIDLFSKSIGCFLNNQEEFDKIAMDTAPFLVISGDNTCNNVLQEFSNSLADALCECGQSVVTTNGRYGAYNNGEILEKREWKGVIGFQAPALGKDYFKKLSCPKIQFWFDNPLYFEDFFAVLDDKYYFFCQDDNYAKHIKKYYGLNNAIQFPPAGIDAGMAANAERIYDIVFIGTYYSYENESLLDDFQKEFFDYMIKNPRYTFEEGLRKILELKGMWVSFENDDTRFLKLLYSLQNVCRRVMHYYRGKVVETILASGIRLDVFGDSWKNYDMAGKDNLVIHPAVSVEESLKVWGNSKIGLNIMTWHKAGMTERIANIMMSGAVCVSDESEYLLNHFKINGDEQEIVVFRLDELDKLSQTIRSILDNDEKRLNIARMAYANSSVSDTWKCRAKKLLEIIK